MPKSSGNHDASSRARLQHHRTIGDGMTYVVRAVGWLAFAALVMGTLIQVSSYFYTPDNAHTALATGFFVMAVVLYMSLRATET